MLKGHIYSYIQNGLISLNQNALPIEKVADQRLPTSMFHARFSCGPDHQPIRAPFDMAEGGGRRHSTKTFAIQEQTTAGDGHRRRCQGDEVHHHRGLR